VVARATGAVAGTLGDAGLVLEHGGPATVAAAVARVLGDGELAGRLAAAGRAQVAAHSLERCARLAVEAIAAVAGPPPGRPPALVGAAS